MPYRQRLIFTFKNVTKPVTNFISRSNGFEVEDKRLGVVGKIESINDTPLNLFEVLNGSVEILIYD
jgi:hypothetical protein